MEASERKIEFFVLEIICNTIFTIEIIFRFIASPNKFAFIKSFSNSLDIIAVLPFWTNIAINHLGSTRDHSQSNVLSEKLPSLIYNQSYQSLKNISGKIFMFLMNSFYTKIISTRDLKEVSEELQ